MRARLEGCREARQREVRPSVRVVAEHDGVEAPVVLVHECLCAGGVFLSEMVAVLNSDLYVREVNIVGDCVWAVYKTTQKTHIDDVFGIAYQANTLIKLLNHHYAKKGIDPLKIGIGVDYGRVLMIKAGFSGSGINDVVYMGDVVNRAAHLAHEAGRGWADPIFVGAVFEQNLNDHNKALLTSRYVNDLGTVHTGNVVSTPMNDWVDTLS